MLNHHEYQRYSRHLVLPEIGFEGQIKLKESRILCVGAGGLGSPALLYLAAAGIGTLGIIDEDTVELSNLQRQIIFTTSDIHLKKVEAARLHLLSLNPSLNIQTFETRLTAENALEIVNAYDLVLDCTDCFSSRYLINDACVALQKPMIYASILRFEGQCAVFGTPNGPCYRCLYPQAPTNESSMNCQNAGVIGALAGILGSIQAMEAIKCLLKIGEPLLERLFLIDALSMRIKDYKIPRHPDCPLCVHKKPFGTVNQPQQTCKVSPEFQWISAEDLKELQRQNTDFLLLDVREPHEYEAYNLGGTLIPLAQLEESLNELDRQKPLIIHCRSDQRSQKAAGILHQHGFKDISVLAGGILAWMRAFE